MPKGRLVFNGDNIYTEKDARIYKLKTSVSSKIDAIPGVVDSLDSTSATDALSANMGRQLQDQINSLSGTGKFLSTWDCTTGLPGTNPQEDPYTYKVGDYYVVSATGSTNYKPHGGTYTQGVPSTTVELENVGVNDKYYFDGADWVRIPDTAIQIGIDTALSTTSTNAVENRAIANAISTKQNIISDLNTIRSGAAAGATALQALDNITELTNNAGYQTAGDVAVAIQSAIGQLPTVNDGVLTIQKNSTTIDTFSANSANNKTINIPVPTTVAELSDANNYATKTDLNNAIDSLIHEGSTAPQNPQEGDMWYDTVNHVLKIYNGTSWETVDTDTDTRYTAGNGINIDANNEISVDTSVVATKTYVDDKMSSGSTAPANPTEGQLWYDTTNDVLKSYDGTNWNIIGGDLSNYLAKDNTMTYTPSGNYNPATKKYVDDSISGAGIVDLSGDPRPSAAYYNGRIGFNSSTGNFYGSDGSDWKEISYKNVICEYVPGVGDPVDNLVEAQWYSVILLSFNESMSDKWIVTDLTWPDAGLGTAGKITAIGYVEESDTTFLQSYGFTEWPKGVTILEISWNWNSNYTEQVCTNLRFIPSSIVSGGTFGAFARECLSYGTEHKTTLNKYYKSSGSGTITDRGTATYTMQGLGFFTGMGWSANSGTVSIAVNGLTIWSETNSSGNYSMKYLNTPITLSPGDEVSVTMSQYGNGDVYADISDFY